MIRRITGEHDPFYEIKERSNHRILGLYPKLKERIEKSDDRLLTAIELAITGNIIDYGIGKFDDIEDEINKLLAHDSNFKSREKAIFELVTKQITCNTLKIQKRPENLKNLLTVIIKLAYVCKTH